MAHRKRQSTSLCKVSYKYCLFARHLYGNHDGLLYSICSPQVMGCSPNQHSTRWSCCSGNGFLDDVHSDSSEGVDGGSECHLDWSRWKSHWCREYHCGTCKIIWHQDHPISYATVPTVTRRRGILLQGSYQCSRIWDTPANISIYTTQCYKYVKTKLTCFYGGLFHESDFLLHNRSGNSSAEIWTIAALCDLDQATRCGYTVCTCMQSVHVCVQLHACRIIEIIKKKIYKEYVWCSIGIL